MSITATCLKYKLVKGSNTSAAYFRGLKWCMGIYFEKYITFVKVIILPVILNGCETWSLTLREEH
jgi:hypothetical protein